MSKPVSLAAFLAQIGQAGTYARQQCEAANIDQLMRYVEGPDDEGVYDFQTIDLRIGENVQSAPLFGLTNRRGMDLDKMRIEFSTNVDLTDSGLVGSDGVTTDGNPHIGIGLTRGLFQRGTEVKVTAEFKLAEDVETLEAIRDKLNKAFSTEG